MNNKSIRGYYDSRKAWYAPHMTDRHDIMIGLYSPEGGTGGEFAFRQEDLGGRVGKVWQLQAFDDALIALARFGDVISELAIMAEREPLTADKICTVLDNCGVRDLTPRVQGEKRFDL